MDDRCDDAVSTGYTKKIKFGCGSLYLTINFDAQQKPSMVLAHLGKTGCCERALLEALLRSLNRHLDAGTSLSQVVHDLVGIRCDKGILGAGRLSCVDAIGHELKAYIVEEDT